MSDYHRFFPFKLLAYRDHWASLHTGAMPFPLDWHIYPSNICNHQCVWCMFRQDTPSGQQGEQIGFRVQLSREVLLRAIDDAARTGAVLVHFSGGGEPLINKATPEAMEQLQHHARQRDRTRPLEAALSTNGRLLTPEVARLVNHIRVSLNAGTERQHWLTNHGGDVNHQPDWSIILANIADALPHKRGDLGLGFVVDADNVHDIPPFLDVATRLGVDFVHIRPAFWYDADSDEATRNALTAMRQYCVDGKERYAQSHTKIYFSARGFDGYWTPRSYDRCRAILTGITLRATGDFAVCQDRTDLTFGTSPSYKAGATFEQVWYSDQHKAVIASVKTGQELDRCPRCVWNGRNELLAADERDEMRIALI